MKFNKTKWNQERLNLESQIKNLKSSIKTGGTREQTRMNWTTGKSETKLETFGPGLGTWQDYRKLAEMKSAATALYQARAEYRGRVHVKGMTKEEQTKLATVRLGDFLLPEPLQQPEVAA